MSNEVVGGQLSKTTSDIDTGPCNSCPRSKDQGLVKIGPKGEVSSFCKVVRQFVQVRMDIKSFEECPNFASSGIFSQVNKT